MTDPNPTLKRRGVSLTGPLYLKRKQGPHRQADNAPHISAINALGPWYNQAALTKASPDNTQLTLGLSSQDTVSPVVMPFAGSIIAMSASVDTKLATAGATIDVKPRIDGVVQSLQLHFTTLTSSYLSTSQTDLTSFVFSAGAKLDVVIDTSANTAMATTDTIAVFLWTT